MDMRQLELSYSCVIIVIRISWLMIVFFHGLGFDRSPPEYRELFKEIFATLKKTVDRGEVLIYCHRSPIEFHFFGHLRVFEKLSNCVVFSVSVRTFAR